MIFDSNRRPSNLSNIQASLGFTGNILKTNNHLD